MSQGLPDLVLEVDYRNHRYNAAEKGLHALEKNLGMSMKGTAKEFAEELRTYLSSVADDLARYHGRSYSGQTAPNRLSKRSGRAVRSIKASVRVRGNTLDSLRGSIGGIGYLRTHEFGATVRAKRVQYLTIPLPAALHANGTPIHRSARQWQNTTIIRSKQGNLLIVQRKGKNVVPLYLLKEEVTIPPRLRMRETLQKKVPLLVDRGIARMHSRMLKNV